MISQTSLCGFTTPLCLSFYLAKPKCLKISYSHKYKYLNINNYQFSKRLDHKQTVQTYT